MMDRSVVAAIAGLLVLASVALPVAASTVDPRFEATVPDPIVTPGSETVVSVQLVNNAEDADDTVRTARQ